MAYQLPGGAWQTGFERGVRRWAEKAPAAVPGREPVPEDRLTLRLLTPLRIKRGGRLVRLDDAARQP